MDKYPQIILFYNFYFNEMISLILCFFLYYLIAYLVYD